MNLHKSNPTPLVRPGVTFGQSGAMSSGAAAAFLAASNTNGAIVWRCGMGFHAAAFTSASIVAKATAPIGVWDGLMLTAAYGGTAHVNVQSDVPFFVPPGQGLYFFYTGATTNGHHFVDYTLL